MTLRDYFAGQVLANIASFELTGDDHPDDVAEATYRIADAMLKARRPRKNVMIEDVGRPPN